MVSQATMSEYIPFHLIANLLLRLPFESLIRFRCVSKSWRYLIDSPYFTEMHSRRSRFIKPYDSHPDSKIIALKESTFCTFDSVHKLGGAYDAIAKELNSLPTEFGDLLGVEFIGSSNGILCLRNLCTDDLGLWNPWIHKYSAMPPPPHEFTKNRGSFGAAFGYDHINDDYKVVKWHTYADFCMHHNDLPSSDRYELCVYGLKLNSWKIIRDAIPFELPEYYQFFSHDCAFANGALHWLATDRPRYVEKFIVAFDLGSEEFRKISCEPCPIHPQYTFQQQLCSLNGRLCFLCFYTSPQGRGQHFRQSYGGDVWVLEDYGVESSWTKLISIDPTHGLVGSHFRPVAFSKKRRQVLLQVAWEKLAIYDTENKSARDVTINGEACSVISCVCVGSFVNPCSSHE